MPTLPPSPGTPPPSHEERAILAAMRSRWEAMFRGTVEDEELERALRYLETPLAPPDEPTTRGPDAGRPHRHGPSGPRGGH